MGYSGELEDNLRRQYLKCKEIGEIALQKEDYQTAEEAYYRAGTAAGKISKMVGEKSGEKWLAISKNYLNASEELRKGISPPLRRGMGNSRTTDEEKISDEKMFGGSKSFRETESSENEFEKFVEESFITNTDVSWDEIGGLTEVKDMIKESVVLSVLNKRPEAVQPWKGILLYGPPGTGKTLLAAATAGGLKATFFNVVIGQVLSKYFGDSSKMITALYEAARKHAPSIVFLDEFDSIALDRGGEVSEASRRILSTLLSELDGLKSKGDNSYVLTMASTNVPWSLDTAVMSRFPKRVYITLPDRESIIAILKIHTVNKGLEYEGDFQEVAERCIQKLYAGRDIDSLCNTAIWNMVREQNPDLKNLADKPFENIRNYRLRTRRLKSLDFEAAFESTESAVKSEDLIRFEQWTREYGNT